MVLIPAGRFMSGSSDGAADAGPPQLVEMASAFGLGKYEVTRAQFARFARESGHTSSGGCFAWNGRLYEQDASKDWRSPGFAQKNSHPVVCVNWNDAKAYTEWLSRKTGKRYRLPGGAEWEYAARAGTQSSRPWGDDANEACRYANVADATAKRAVAGSASWTFHACSDRHAHTAPVGSYPPNAFGLHDMLGNVWEWTEDCSNEERAGAAADGRGGSGAACGQRVLRGGAWVDSPPFVRFDFRFMIGAEDRDFYIGFRVLRTIDATGGAR